jgi:hypothetical protein
MGSPSRLLILMTSRPLGPSLPVNPLLMLPSLSLVLPLPSESEVHNNPYCLTIFLVFLQ